MKGKRFLEEIDTFFQNAMMSNDITSVTRHVKGLKLRVVRRHQINQFTTVHIGHDDIRNQQLNVPGILFGKKNCLCRSFSCKKPDSQAFGACWFRWLEWSGHLRRQGLFRCRAVRLLRHFAVQVIFHSRLVAGKY